MLTLKLKIMFRTISILAAVVIICSSCNNSSSNNKNQAATKLDSPVSTGIDTTPVDKPGSDRDEKGCIPSAGYRWSVMKDSCIRIFEAGIKMLPKDPALDQTTAAYLVFSKDRVRVEMFLPTQEKAVIIRLKEGIPEPTVWASGPLTLTLKDGVYLLDDEGKLLYQSEVVK